MQQQEIKDNLKKLNELYQKLEALINMPHTHNTTPDLSLENQKNMNHYSDIINSTHHLIHTPTSINETKKHFADHITHYSMEIETQPNLIKFKLGDRKIEIIRHGQYLSLNEYTPEGKQISALWISTSLHFKQTINLLETLAARTTGSYQKKIASFNKKVKKIAKRYRPNYQQAQVPEPLFSKPATPEEINTTMSEFNIPQEYQHQIRKMQACQSALEKHQSEIKNLTNPLHAILDLPTINTELEKQCESPPIPTLNTESQPVLDAILDLNQRTIKPLNQQIRNLTEKARKTCFDQLFDQRKELQASLPLKILLLLPEFVDSSDKKYTEKWHAFKDYLETWIHAHISPSLITDLGELLDVSNLPLDLLSPLDISPHEVAAAQKETEKYLEPLVSETEIKQMADNLFNKIAPQLNFETLDLSICANTIGELIKDDMSLWMKTISQTWLNNVTATKKEN